MKQLNDELRITADKMREERDALRTQVEQLSGQVEALRGELREARDSLSGQMTELHDKIDEWRILKIEDFDKLVEEAETGKHELHWTRQRFLATWLAVAVLALLTGIALLLGR